MAPSEKKMSSAPLISGVLGGSASTILLYPLDLVKVRWQVREDSITNIKSVNPTGQRPTILSSMRGIVRYEGMAGLYQGLSPALVGSAVSWGGYFFLYEGIKLRMMEGKRPKSAMAVSNDLGKNRNQQLQNDGIRLGPLENFMAACSAGAAMVVCTNPIWLIKTRMQLQLKHIEAEHVIHGSSTDVKPPYKNMFDAARTIVKEEGVLALYKGAAPAMMLTTHGGIQFVAYEYLKATFGTYTKANRSTSGKNSGVMHQLQDSVGYLTMGAVSKIIASTVTYPLQVIKSRLQQRSQTAEWTAAGDVKIMKREYAGVIDCVSRISKREGIVGFFKGCIPNAIRVAPNAAITLVVYESVMNVLS